MPLHSLPGDKYPIKPICDLRENHPEQCVIIGTLYKHQELKPSVLREISESHLQAPPPPRHHFFGDDDKLILEDDLQRILLVGEVDPHCFVTGVVCAILGKSRLQRETWRNFSNSNLLNLSFQT
jgi:DNA polymerase delta subunit 2